MPIIGSLKSVRVDRVEPDDYLFWQGQNKKTLKRINVLLKDCQHSPFEGIGKPEALLHQHSGYWSRRLDDTHRLVYSADDKNTDIIACRDHY